MTSSTIEHLLVLRTCLIKILASVFVLFLLLSYWSKEIYQYISIPLLQQLPENNTMIAIDVSSSFFIPFKLTFFVASFLAIPYILYQAWYFISPGLYQKEKKLILPLLFTSTLLFYMGIFFCYYIVFPVIFHFFASMTPDTVQMTTDIEMYFNFVLKLFFAFGFTFEIPILIVLMTYYQIISIHSLIQQRSYVIVGAFIIGMLLTPPDILSQTLLAIPIIILYELGIIVAKIYEKNNKKNTKQDKFIQLVCYNIIFYYIARLNYAYRI